MANTYHQMYLQTVFAVKHQKALIQQSWKTELFAVIGNLINDTGSKTILVNGVEDHVHCFFGLKPSISVSDLMKSVKAKSSKWINENNLHGHRFEWQAGFGSFSYSHSHSDRVYQYIKKQEEHHKKVSFLQEYKLLLEKFGIDYDERYIFREPQ